MPLERLQKIIAAAGVASRRKAEELIQSGLVSVNGNTVTELGTKADAQTDSIRVKDKLLKGAERHEYIILNKPKGYVTTVSDPEGRPTVMELVQSKARLYPIGRLDFNSEGLLLLTNDGVLAHKLMQAASHIPKTYMVKVAGQPAEDQLRRLRAGVSIAEERDPRRRVKTAPAQVRIIKEAENPWLEVALHEGRNRQIRKMFEEIGHHVEKIRRIQYGPLELDLAPGESRPLTTQEVFRLQQATNSQAKPRFTVGRSSTEEFRQRREKAFPRPVSDRDREQDRPERRGGGERQQGGRRFGDHGFPAERARSREDAFQPRAARGSALRNRFQGRTERSKSDHSGGQERRKGLQKWESSDRKSRGRQFSDRRGGSGEDFADRGELKHRRRHQRPARAARLAATDRSQEGSAFVRGRNGPQRSDDKRTGKPPRSSNRGNRGRRS